MSPFPHLHPQHRQGRGHTGAKIALTSSCSRRGWSPASSGSAGSLWRLWGHRVTEDRDGCDPLRAARAHAEPHACAHLARVHPHKLSSVYHFWDNLTPHLAANCVEHSATFLHLCTQELPGPPWSTSTASSLAVPGHSHSTPPVLLYPRPRENAAPLHRTSFLSPAVLTQSFMAHKAQPVHFLPTSAQATKHSHGDWGVGNGIQDSREGKRHPDGAHLKGRSRPQSCSSTSGAECW